MSVLAGVSLVMLFGAVIFHTTAFSSSYWLTADVDPKSGKSTSPGGVYHFGVWTTCYQAQDFYGNLSAADLTWSCDSTNNWIYVTKKEYQGSWLGGFQAMTTIAFITSVVSFACLVVQWCMTVCSDCKRDTSLRLIYGASCAAFATACFSMISLTICGSKPAQDDTAVFHASLSWSFYLALTADVLIWVSSATTLADFATTLQIPA